MDHSFDFSNDYNDSFAIVSASNVITSGSGGQSSSDACNQSIIVDNDRAYVRRTVDKFSMSGKMWKCWRKHKRSSDQIEDQIKDLRPYYDTMIHSEKSCKDFRVHEWIHLVTSLLTNCAYLTLAGYLMYKYMSDSDHYVISTVIIVKFVYATYFLFHGIFREQPFQIIMQTMTLISMWLVDLIYTLYNIVRLPDRLETPRTDPEMILFYARTAGVFINLLTSVGVAWKYFSLEQAIFRTVGTDMNRVSILRSLFFGFSLMVFDMEISLSALLLFLRNGFSNIVVHEIAILSAGSVFIILWIYLGYRAVRTESHMLTWIFYLVSAFQPAYILCLFIRNLKWTGSSEPALVISSHVISVIALIAHFGVLAAIVTVHHFYGRGFGNALIDGVHVSVKNSAEYEELRRILFHPINPIQNYYNPNTSSRTILINAEVY